MNLFKPSLSKKHGIYIQSHLKEKKIEEWGENLAGKENNQMNIAMSIKIYCQTFIVN